MSAFRFIIYYYFVINKFTKTVDLVIKNYLRKKNMPAPVSNYPYLESDSGSSNYSSPYSSDASVSSFDEFYYPNLSKRRGNKPNKMKNKSNGKRSVNSNHTVRTNNNNMTSCSTNGNGYQIMPWYKNQNVIIGGAALTGLIIIAAFFAYRMYKQKNEVVNSLMEMNDELNTYKVAYAKVLQNQNNNRVVVDEKNNQSAPNPQPSSSSVNVPFPPSSEPPKSNHNHPQMQNSVLPAPLFKKPSPVSTTHSSNVTTTHRGPPPQFPVAPIMGDFMKSLFGKDMFSPMTPPKPVHKTSSHNSGVSDKQTGFEFPMNVMIIEQMETKGSTPDHKVTVEEEFEEEVKDLNSGVIQQETDDTHNVIDSTEPKNEKNINTDTPPPLPSSSKPKQSNNKGGKRKKVIQDLN